MTLTAGNGTSPLPTADVQTGYDIEMGRGVPWDILEHTLIKIAVASCIVGYIIAGYVAIRYHMTPRWIALSAPLLLMTMGVAVLGIRLSYRSRALLLIVSLWIAAILMNVCFTGPYIGLAYAMACVVAGVLLGLPAALITAGAGTAAIIAQMLLTPSSPSAMSSLAVLWACTIMLWLVMGDLYFTVVRSEASVQLAWDQVRESRLRKGQLNAMVHSLEEAAFRIERLNHELNHALLEAEVARMQKSRFAATVSHEIRGPLNLILGFSRLITLSPEHYGQALPPAYRADVEAIYRNSEHLATLVDDILDLAQIDAERLPLVKCWVDIEKDILSEAVNIVRPLAENRGLFIRQDPSAKLPPLFADPVRLRQVLLNLLMNAIRFTQYGGITVSVSLQDDAALISVSDTGVGIAPDDIPRLFQEFSDVYQRSIQSQEGSGLGLSISKRLVELHGGRIWVESHKGVGTTFHFTLPLADTQTLSRIRTVQGYSPTLTSHTLLVVHDDPTVVRLLARYLEGYHVVGVHETKEIHKLANQLQPWGIITTLEESERVANTLATLCEDEQFAAVSPILITCPMNHLTPHTNLGGQLSYLVKPITREMLFAVMQQVNNNHEQPVLVVDDDLDSVRLLESMLISLPWPGPVLKAYDGQQALELMDHTVPGVVLMDLVMPRLDGEEAIHRMRADERLRDVPVVVISAREAMSASDGAVMMGMPLSIMHRKPLEIGQGAKCIKAMFDALGSPYGPEPKSPAPTESAPDAPLAFEARESRLRRVPDQAD